MRIGLLAAASSLVLVAGSTPAAPPATPAAAAYPWEQGLSLLRAGAYLRSLDALDPAACRATSPEDYSYNVWRQVRAMIGAYAAPPPVTPGQEPLSELAAARFRRAQVQDAVTAIAAAARSKSIVILNQGAGSPREHLFALQVARALRPLGYDMLALEALDNPARVPGRLERDGFVRRNSGSYTLNDPVLADFVRQALAIGYTPLAYEETFDQHLAGGAEWPRRWQSQAENLAAQIKLHPGHKLFVYAGFMQVPEETMKRSWGTVEPTAARLKKITGIDPLTIEQASVSADTLYRPGREAWRLIAPRLRRSSVLRLDGHAFSFGGIARATDLQVLHPRTRFRSGRPDWLLALGRRPSAIPRRLLPRTGRRLVQAFLASEPEDAIPVDQVLVEAGRPAPSLMLPPRAIRYAVQNPDLRRAPSAASPDPQGGIDPQACRTR